jgi:alkanesulfonate monooxygenase SsuD/methylene tetrahydromethanopterin reductase-like flavin-dependent oxidoreductase (luciferase family)
MKYSAFSLCEAVPGFSHIEALDHLLTQVDIADQAGLDSWFFAEHHSNPRYSLTPSPNVLIAAASQRTTNIRLGNMVTVLPYHHPLRAAEEIRLLDAISKGRLEVGLGRGGAGHEQVAYGVEGPVEEAFLTGIELLLRFLTEESVDYDTALWKGSNASAVPEATQHPYPPIWLAAVSDQSLHHAARFGLNCELCLSYPALLARQMESYRTEWHKLQPGKPVGKVGVLVYTVVGESEKDALQYGKLFVQQKINGFLKSFSSHRGSTDHSPSATSRLRLYEYISKLTFTEWIDESLVIFGSVDQCVEQVQRLQAIGADMLTAWIQFAHLDFGFANESLRLFCEEVIPRVTERAPLAP